MQIRELTPMEVDQANERLASIGFQPSRPGADRTFGAFDGERLVGLGRLQRQGDETEIGGFWVDPERRGEGIARRVVAHVLAQIEPGAHAWCIPFGHLVEFYRSFGMVEIPPTDAPAAIASKLAFCAARHADGTYPALGCLLRYTGQA